MRIRPAILKQPVNHKSKHFQAERGNEQSKEDGHGRRQDKWTQIKNKIGQSQKKKKTEKAHKNSFHQSIVCSIKKEKKMKKAKSTKERIKSEINNERQWSRFDLVFKENKTKSKKKKMKVVISLPRNRFKMLVRPGRSFSVIFFLFLTSTLLSFRSRVHSKSFCSSGLIAFFGQAGPALYPDWFALITILVFLIVPHSHLVLLLVDAIFGCATLPVGCNNGNKNCCSSFFFLFFWLIDCASVVNQT